MRTSRLPSCRRFLDAGCRWAAVSRQRQQGSRQRHRDAAEIDRATSCAPDGMLLADYPGSKVQMHYAGVGAPRLVLDTIGMFNVYLNPEQARQYRDLRAGHGQGLRNRPRHWIDA